MQILAWCGRERPELGDRALNQIEAGARRLVRFPQLGPVFPRIAPDARKLSVDRYLVLYRIDVERIFIVRVVDQRMLLEAIEFKED